MFDPSRFASVEPVQGFVGNKTFRLRTDAGETLYYKSGAATAMAAESWACERAHLVRRLRALRVPPRLGEVAPRLLHGDLHPRHIYAEGNELTGFIDWGDVAFGDPLFDLGRFSRAGSAATAALLRGDGIERTASLEWMLIFYRTIWAVKAMHWEHAAGGDWYVGHLDAIAADLPLLELSR